MECCVGVSAETVLQIVKFYTVVRRILKLMFRTVVLRRWTTKKTKDYSSKHQFENSFHYGVKLISS